MNTYLSVARLTVGILAFSAVSFGSAIDFTDAPVSHDSQLSIGFVFTTNEAINITSLGYYDENQDGFLTDHEIGIFDSHGVLLVSTILGAGSGTSLEGHYRYGAVNTITLEARSLFLVAATTFGPLDGWAYGHQDTTLMGFVVDPSISIASDASRFVYQDDNILRAAGQMFGFTMYGGPNFKGMVDGVVDIRSDVPEPASAALALSGFAGLLLLCLLRLRQFNRSTSILRF